MELLTSTAVVVGALALVYLVVVLPKQMAGLL